MVVSANAQLFEKTELGIETTINAIDLEIQFYNPSIIRVVKSPSGKTYEKRSLSVIKSPEKTDLNIIQTGDELILKSESIQVALNLQNGKIAFSLANGKTLLKEQSVKFVEFEDAGVKTYSIYQSYILDKDEAIYGLGQQQNGSSA